LGDLEVSFMRKAVAIFVVGSAFASMFACGSDGSDTSGFDVGGGTTDGGADAAATCAGEKLECTCSNFPSYVDGGKPQGFQCKVDGSWGPCQCVAPPPRCGDGICQALEDCTTCRVDCGECPKCAEAPACDKAKTPPLSFVALPALDTRFVPSDVTRQGGNVIRTLVAQGSPEFRALVQALLVPPAAGEHPFLGELRTVLNREPGLANLMRSAIRNAGLADAAGYLAKYPPVKPSPRQLADANAIACGPPKLRIRLQSVKVLTPENEPFIGSDGDKIYCILTSESNNGSEIRITPVTPRLDSGQSYSYSLYEGVFWGQDLPPSAATGADAGGGTLTYEVPRAPNGDLMLTYRCWSQHNDQTWSNILSAAGNASASVAGVAGSYGWAFGLGAVVGQVAAAAVAAAQQDIATVYNAQQIIPEAQQLAMTNGVSWRVTGGKNGANYEMAVQAWGCAVNGGGKRDAGF
jgi:hypothetical protein